MKQNRHEWDVKRTRWDTFYTLAKHMAEKVSLSLSLLLVVTRVSE